MKKIKILYVIGQLSVGGTELQLLELVKKLDKDIFEIRVVCLSGSAIALSPRFMEIGCHPILLYREKNGRIITLLKLSRVIWEFKPDIIHAFAYASRAVVPVASLISKAKIIISIRTNPDWQIAPQDKFLNRMADLILTNSYEAKRSIENYWSAGACKVIYNGLDVRRFRELGQSEPLRIPIDANLDDGCKKIALVARLEPVKQAEVAIEALHFLSKKNQNIQLWIVGFGSQFEKLQAMCARLELQKSAIFWKEHDNVPSILKYCSMGILSSKVEGLSNSILEYMAASLPVVATDAGGNSELVIHNETGLLVPSGDPGALADALFFLITHPEIAHEFGDRGRERIQKMFDVTRMVKETEAVYQKLVLK